MSFFDSFCLDENSATKGDTTIEERSSKFFALGVNVLGALKKGLISRYRRGYLRVAAMASFFFE